MSKTANKFLDYVFNLSNDEFSSLKEAVFKREDRDLYGVTSFEEAAIKYGRKPVCPKCGSTSNHEDGYTDSKHKGMNAMSVLPDIRFYLIPSSIPLRYHFINF